jgi:hypothetical protein
VFRLDRDKRVETIMNRISRTPEELWLRIEDRLRKKIAESDVTPSEEQLAECMLNARSTYDKAVKLMNCSSKEMGEIILDFIAKDIAIMELECELELLRPS